MSAMNGQVGDVGYLTYVSSAVESFSPAALKTLLQISRRNNLSPGITGLLLYRNGRFLQYLEGPGGAAKTTYQHIIRDPRHDSFRVVGTGRLEVRMFPEWSMGYKNLGGIRAANTEGYSECLQSDFRSANDGDPAGKLTKLFYDLIEQS